MSPEIIFDPYTRLYSEAASLARSSDIRDLMSVIGRSDVISLAGGLPFVGGIPAEDISTVMDEVLKRGLHEALQYGSTEGHEGLRSKLVDVMAGEGIRAEPEHVLVTTGSQQALDLLARAFLDPGDLMMCEGPTYVGALSAFRPTGAEFVAIPLDDSGMRTDLIEAELERRAGAPPKFIYVVPTFHNPGGVTMCPERRDHLLGLAEKHDILIVEDNPYGLLRFEGEPVTPLAARGTRRVVYLGTLSKIVSPGIRVGWVYAEPPVIDRLVKLKQGADLCSSALNQMFAEAYIEKGLWQRNIEVLKPVYRSRKDAMLAAMEEFFPEGARWTNPGGGLFVWATLPRFLDTAKMLPAAIENKVAYVPGSAFFPDGSGAHHMRLNFSFSDEDRIAEGIKRLGKVIRREIELYRSLGLDRGSGEPPLGG